MIEDTSRVTHPSSPERFSYVYDRHNHSFESYAGSDPGTSVIVTSHIARFPVNDHKVKFFEIDRVETTEIRVKR